MKLLWLSNVLFPEVCTELNLPIPVIGGWMESGAKSLINDFSNHIDLAVVMLYNGNEVIYIDKYKIKYYLIPRNGSSLKFNFEEVNKHFRPDLVHIHGTEYSHSLAYINSSGTSNVVVSIQGLVSVYSRYYFGGIKRRQLFPSLRDILKIDTLFLQYKDMVRRGKNEIELLKKIEHVIGRTRWDQSNVWAINPFVTYHLCNETLRDSFYSIQWKMDECEPYSIFLSQAHYPIKGLQQVIKAVSIVKLHCPEIKVKIAGVDLLNKSFWKISGYGNYIKRLLRKYDVFENFIFLGSLSEKEITLQYLKANIFICPSSIENSPNSVGEAQLVGTPCIASYVGGNMDMIEDKVSGFLYRYEEVELLAYRICQLFENPKLCKKFSNQGRIAAQLRHDSRKNAQDLFFIYTSILNQ
ncbi:glycosyltransferase involved in cell wall biosynthesis [Runella defluvii]|uniref:Glycosyltransferase involved in cell wall biosynthesis n=1 Tax=Runella defluvii TaxID=370973 RepID=A0A7W5ZQ16_9BACT|nr:glycosyltransferase family 4 protein [Runella defluvii]MBB3839607.1 glycosyltransferase involved in cell wall biosynthesis [Runella defluvii]